MSKVSILKQIELLDKFNEQFNKIEQPVNSAREAFHRNRSGLFTASEIHKLLTPTRKESKSKTSHDYIIDKAFETLTGETSRQEVFSKSIAWGNEHEKDAVNAYMEHTGNNVVFYGDEQKFLKHPTLPIGAYPDGILEVGGQTLECKCPANGGEQLKNMMCGSDVEKLKNLRFEYYIQVQVQILLSESDFGEFFAYRPLQSGDKLIYYLRVPRCEDTIKSIVDVVSSAYEQMQIILKSI